MASRTIENERDRRMTVMTTTFIPCGAKLPVIALIASALFGGSAWVGTSAYFIGIAAIVVSGLMLKKTSMFAGDPAPFVMELPAYHMPSLTSVLRITWERGWSFVKKAGTVILLSAMVLWFLQSFGFTEHGFEAFRDDTIIRDSGKIAAVYNNEPPHYIEVDGVKILTAANIAMIPSAYTVHITDKYGRFIEMIRKSLYI